MRRYEFSRAADRDLDDIYVYTFRQFGELQADAYFESLEECLGKLADNPLLGVDASNLRAGYRRFVHQRHTLYYKKVRPESGSSASWGRGCPSNDPWKSTGNE